MADITPDIIQWLLMDEKVARKWKSFAWRLGLVEFVVDIECWRGGQGRRRRGTRERDKLEMLLRMWKEKKPDTYNVRMLKTVLAAEGLNDMWMWINIITQDTKVRPHTGVSTPTTSPTPTSPWSKYLYSPSSTSSYSSYSQSTCPESDYSPLHSSPSLSRPDSQLSDYAIYRHSSPPACHSHPGYTSSCPTTPLSCRRQSHSPSYQACPPPASPYRSSHTPSTSPAKTGVFSTLFRPDLIRLSSYRGGSIEKYKHGDGEDFNRKNVEKSRLREYKHIDSISDTRFNFEQNRMNKENKTDSSIANVCDEVLEEDLYKLNFSGKSNIGKATKAITNTSDKYNSTNNYKQSFYVEKVKMVELSNLNISDVGENAPADSDESSSIPSACNNTHDEYFDNLLLMIEKAAHDLNF